MIPRGDGDENYSDPKVDDIVRTVLITLFVFSILSLLFGR